jgi:Histidine phosphatase superfamily (branch 1)
VSDLQCAATFVFVVPEGIDEVRALVPSLRDRRCAAVYAGGLPGLDRAGLELAEPLGLAVVPESRLHDPVPDEQEADAVVRLRGLLAEIADEHRGETVAVVAPGHLLQRALPTLASNVPALYGERHPPGSGEAAEMRVDADGWVLTSWNGRRLDESTGD